MKRYLFILLITLFQLFAHQSLEHAQEDKIFHTQRGFAMVSHQGKMHTFSYTTIQKDYSKKIHNGLSYFKRLELNDNHSLVMRTLSAKKGTTPKQFHFFMGTKNIKAKVVHDNFIFLAAQTHDGYLKIALLDKDYHMRLSQTIKTLNVEKIYNIFQHLDGSYSLALKINNHKKKLSYFDRGTGERNFAILRFSSLLHLLQTHTLGDTQLHDNIEVLKDRDNIYYLFSQSTPTQLTLYKHNFSTNTNSKKVYSFNKACHLQTVSTPDFTHFYLGADKNIWLSLNTTKASISDFELAKVQNATIRTITKLDDNSMLISGTFRSDKGEKDIFIHNYSPYQSYLWGKSFHSDFNDQSVTHKVLYDRIYLSALINDKNNYKKVALFTLDRHGNSQKH